MLNRSPVLTPVLLVLVTLAVSCAAFPAGALAEDIPDKTFDDWTTLTYKGDSVVYVALTTDSQNRNVELHLGKYQGKCEAVKMYVFLTFINPSDKDYGVDNVPGELRVDQYPVHKTTSRSSSKKGTRSGSYFVHSFENPQSVLKEMAEGQVVRFRFKVGEQEHYYRFSLKGFGPAYQRISQMCSQPVAKAKPAQPKPEGGSKSGGKSDADFFGPGKSGGKTQKTDKDYF